MTDRIAIRQTLCQFLQEDAVSATVMIDDATDLRGGLGLDSVDFVGLVMRIEGHYRIRLSREELETLVTVGDLLSLVETKTKNQATTSAAAA